MSEYLVPPKNKVFVISECDREELEDLYLRSYDFIIELKKEMNQKDIKMKKMATKLLRMARDQPQVHQQDDYDKTRLKNENLQLKTSVKQLKTKLQQIKPLAPTQSRSYQNVSSRINSNLARSLRDNSFVGTESRKDEGLRMNNMMRILSKREEEVRQLKDEIDDKNQQLEEIKEEFKAKIERMEQNMEDLSKPDITDNVELMASLRTIKEWKNKYEILQQKFVSLQKAMVDSNKNSDRLVDEIKKLSEIREEDEKIISDLQFKLNLSATSNTKISELQFEVATLKRESVILKEANDQLLRNSFAQKTGGREEMLKNQIHQLESAMKADLESKNNMIRRLSSDKIETEKVSFNLNLKMKENEQLKEQINFLQNQIEILSQNRETEITELNHAFLEAQKPPNVDLTFIKKFNEIPEEDLQDAYKKLQVDYAETAAELWKTHEMLMVQHKISQDYQKEICVLNEKIKLGEKHHREREKETTLKMETKLKKDLKIFPEEKFEEIENLKIGQNVFEFNIREAIIAGEDNNDSHFCVFEFFDFEMVATHILAGNRPQFNFNAKYLVTMDDFFIEYLRRGTAQIELLQSAGQTFRPLGSAKINFKDILYRPQTTFLQSSVSIFNDGSKICEIFYSFKMKEPFEKSLLEYQRQLKSIEAVLPSQGTFVEVKIEILRCTAVKSNKGVIPSLYAVYSFFDHLDQDTGIIPSENPEFGDSRCFRLCLNSELDSYLRTNDLIIYIFDDNEDEDSSYLCAAKIPLVSLARGKAVKGPFQLLRENGTPNGFVDVSISWETAEEPTQMTSDAINQKSPKLSQNFVLELPEKSKIDKTTIKESSPPPKQATPLKSTLSSKKNIPENEITKPPLPKPQQTQNDKTTIDESSPPPKQATPLKSILSSKKNVSDDRMAITKPPSPKILGLPPPPEIEVSPPQKSKEIPNSPEADQGKPSSPQIVEPPKEGKPPSLKMPDPPKKSSMPAIKTSTEPKRVRISDSNIIIEDDSYSQSKTDYNEEDDFEFSTEDVSEDPESPTEEVKNEEVEITIHSFSANSRLISNPKVKNLFVSYRFLNLPAEETETDFSLAKSQQKMEFNYNKVFNVNHVKNYENRQNLALMLIKDDPEENGIYFSVVSEPEIDADGDCEDIGRCFVSIKKILAKKQDFVENEFLVTDSRGEEIGTLTLTVKCYDVLKAITDELDR